MALSLCCDEHHNGLLEVPDRKDVKHAREIRESLKSEYEAMLAAKIILDTSMAKEYLAFLSGNEIDLEFDKKFQKKIKKTRYRDIFEDFPTTGANSANLYTYGAIFVLFESSDIMPAVNLTVI